MHASLSRARTIAEIQSVQKRAKTNEQDKRIRMRKNNKQTIRHTQSTTTWKSREEKIARNTQITHAQFDRT